MQIGNIQVISETPFISIVVFPFARFNIGQKYICTTFEQCSENGHILRNSLAIQSSYKIKHLTQYPRFEIRLVYRVRLPCMWIHKLFLVNTNSWLTLSTYLCVKVAFTLWPCKCAWDLQIFVHSIRFIQHNLGSYLASFFLCMLNKAFPLCLDVCLEKA